MANYLSVENKKTGASNGSLDHGHGHGHPYNNEEETYDYATQILNSCVLPMALNSIIDLGVLNLIHEEAASSGLLPAELAARIQAQSPEAPDMLDRLLRVLASYSVVSCTLVTTTDGTNNGEVQRRYGPTPITKYFVPDHDGVSLAPMLSMAVDKVYLSCWSKMKEAVIEGGTPFNKVHGMHHFEYQKVDPKFNKMVNKTMYDQSTNLIKKIVKNYKGFQNIETLVDVGGGLGHCIHAIISQYPSIKGINFDLPHVIHNAPPLPGVEHVGGDMFDQVPNGDAIFMKWILHDRSDDRCLVLLKNCYKALPENGKVIVVEVNITEEPETTSRARAISQLDVNMMTICPAGKERTRKQFEVMAKASGFSGVNFDYYVSHFWVMEFYK